MLKLVAAFLLYQRQGTVTVEDTARLRQNAHVLVYNVTPACSALAGLSLSGGYSVSLGALSPVRSTERSRLLLAQLHAHRDSALLLKALKLSFTATAISCSYPNTAPSGGTASPFQASRGFANSTALLWLRADLICGLQTS